MTPSIIFLVLIAIITVSAVFITFFTKQFINKKNAFYFVPIFLVAWGMYTYAFIVSNSYDSLTFFDCLQAAWKIFGFDIKRDFVEATMQADSIFSISFIWLSALAGLTTFSTVLGLAKVSIANTFRFWYRTYKGVPCIVLGDSDEAKNFAKKEKRSFIWLSAPYTKPKFTSQEKESFYHEGVVYYAKPFNDKNLKRILYRHRKSKVHIVVFEDGASSLKALTSLIEQLELNESHIVEFHVSASPENEIFVGKQLSLACHTHFEGHGNIVAVPFNAHELIGRRFISEHNFARYLPKGFIEGGLLQKGKKIQAVFLGAGKTSNAILRHVILDNCFVQDDGKGFYKVAPVSYFLFDRNEEAFEKQVVHLFGKEPAIGCPSIEKTAIVEARQGNVETELESLLEPLISDLNAFTYYFVSIGESLDNASLASRLSELVQPNEGMIFYCVDSEQEAQDFSIPGRIEIKANGKEKDRALVVPFGFKLDVLTAKFIIDDKWSAEAEVIHGIYNSLKGDKKPSTDFFSRNIVEKQSNLYANLNLRFKLNLLGLDLIEGKEDDSIGEDEFHAIYPGGKVSSYKDYFSQSVPNIMRFQEKNRWNTFYYLNGFSTMKAEEMIPDANGKIIHKDILKRKHACLVSYRELDKFHRFKAKLAQKANPSLSEEEALEQVDVYQYDTMLLDELFKEKKLADRSILVLLKRFG